MSEEHGGEAPLAIVDETALGPIEGPECCILEVCCGGEEQIEALAMKLRAEMPWLHLRQSLEVAAVIVRKWDLAPAGSLRVFKRAIATLARKYPAHEGYE